MTHYILIDASTRAPVPLPWEAEDDDGPLTVYDYRPAHEGDPAYLCCKDNWTKFAVLPADIGLALISEADFMKEQHS